MLLGSLLPLASAGLWGVIGAVRGCTALCTAAWATCHGAGHTAFTTISFGLGAVPVTLACHSIFFSCETIYLGNTVLITAGTPF
jgi:hypothetical protein